MTVFPFHRARWATVPCCGVWCGQWFWSCLAGRLDWFARYFTVCSARVPRVATAVPSLSICWTVASSSLWLVHRIWWRGSRCVKHVGCINPKFLTLLILWPFSYNDVPEILHAFCTIDVFIKGNVLRVTFKRFFFEDVILNVFIFNMYLLKIKNSFLILTIKFSTCMICVVYIRLIWREAHGPHRWIEQQYINIGGCLHIIVTNCSFIDLEKILKHFPNSFLS